MSKIILVTGGARSGKSRYAEARTIQLGGNIAYIATAVPFDDGMKDRIQKHQKDRPSHWTTVEQPVRLHEAMPMLEPCDTLLLDCVTVLLNNYLFEQDWDFDTVSHDAMDALEAEIIDDLQRFVEEVRQRDKNLILVTNEVGSGIVPENRLARLYRDVAGRINQVLGQLADEVILVVCGQTLVIKG